MPTFIISIGLPIVLGGIAVALFSNLVLGITIVVAGAVLMAIGIMVDALQNMDKQLREIAVMNKKIVIIMERELGINQR